MQKWLRLLNFAALAVFGFSTIRLGLMRPEGALPAVLNLLPFAFALLASANKRGKSAARIALGLNAFWAIGYTAILFFVSAGAPGGVLSVALFAVPVGIVCLLNVRYFWPEAFVRVGV